ncbi:hypothetical protein FN846DRAFT_906013 [Sphaerosporella brunnea]|uniref:Uncharacterized protein n=1 Tax=Sphaerosporella brunnea TaxID=1250544 RepID=A0A5J5EZR2_9PEZI|nr:hypothetical protein FN846DRAFT_906013 [Sphaerosporella brunnea]
MDQERVSSPEDKFTKVFIEDLYTNENRLSVNHKAGEKKPIASTRAQQGLLMSGTELKAQINKRLHRLDVFARRESYPLQRFTPCDLFDKHESDRWHPGHCSQMKVSYEIMESFVIQTSFGTVDNRKLALGLLSGSYSVRPVAHHGYAYGTPIPADRAIPIALDVSLLEMVDRRRALPSESAGMPSFTQNTKFIAFYCIHVTSFRHTEEADGKRRKRVMQFPDSHNTAVNVNTSHYRQFVSDHIVPRLLSPDLIQLHEPFVHTGIEASEIGPGRTIAVQENSDVGCDGLSLNVPPAKVGVWEKE